MENQNQKICRNCTSKVQKGIKRCPYCGILNPTLEIKEIIIGIFGVLVVMGIYTFFFQN